MTSGNPNLPQVGAKGIEREFFARKFLKKQGYEIIHGSDEFLRRVPRRKFWIHRLKNKISFEDFISLQKKLEIVTDDNHGLCDYICKKDSQYFVFEIKYKIWKEGRPHFNSSEKQISEYDRIQKTGKVKVKVLTIIEKDQKLSHSIYDWDDFEKTKTTIKLKK